jgi:hypothetical protein
MGCLYYPRKQTSVSYAADCDVIVYYGAAEPADQAIAACGGDAREAVTPFSKPIWRNYGLRSRRVMREES